MAPSTTTVALGLTMASAAMAFTPSSFSPRSQTALKVAVDPSTVTKKEYEDICGVSFDDQSLEQRLKRTSFLYPKHVEVIEDIAPIADEMVDNIVSTDSQCVIMCRGGRCRWVEILQEAPSCIHRKAKNLPARLLTR